MRPRLRTIAFLMLLAGLSLGIFTARALRAMGGDPAAGPAPRHEPRVEAFLELLRRDHHLTADQTRRAGEVLRRYDRSVRQKLYDLRVEHQAEFRALFDEAQGRIDAILLEASQQD